MTIVTERSAFLVWTTLIPIKCLMLTSDELAAILLVDGVGADGTIRVAALGRHVCGEERLVGGSNSMLQWMQTYFDCIVVPDGSCEAHVPFVQPYAAWLASSVLLHSAVVDGADWRRSFAAPSQIVAACGQSNRWNDDVRPCLPCATLDDFISLTIPSKARPTYAGNSRTNLDPPSSALNLSSLADLAACHSSRGCRWHGRPLSLISKAPQPNT